MNHIVNITREASAKTLVLADELGSGTDPTEGAALAIAVLDYLKAAGAMTIATTHYNELKKYAISTPGVMNASMQFDIETLSPTYKLLVGAPGRSNAFEISEKLGLSPDIIETARHLLQTGDIEFENVISAIEQDRRAAETERDEAIMLNIAMKKQKEELEKLEAKIKSQKDKILSDAREEARRMLRETRELSRQVAGELRELSKIESLGERNQRYDENRNKLRKAEGKYRETIAVDTNYEPVDAAKLKIGNRVKVMSIGQNGEILTLPDEKGDLQVQVGIMKINVNVRDLMLIEQGRGKHGRSSAASRRTGGLARAKMMSVSLSVNVQGETLDSAVADVDKYLDDAFLAGLETVTIIHGRGEGILRNGIARAFKAS